MVISLLFGEILNLESQDGSECTEVRVFKILMGSYARPACYTDIAGKVRE